MFSINDYDFDLPRDLVASEPLEKRDASRLLKIDRLSGCFDDASFVKLPEILRPGDVLVLNDTRVFPARLLGRTSTGAKVEVFLVRNCQENLWEALARPAKRLPAGKQIDFDKNFSCRVVENLPSGQIVVELSAEGDLSAAIDRVGRTPLPPYIKRPEGFADQDRKRYQTVYARERGAIAAPTAGLHFTPEIFADLRSRNIEVEKLTLHVGYGTFEPVRVSDLREHTVMPEQFEVSADTAARLNKAKAEGRRIIAVGTTTTRALETNFNRHDQFAPEKSDADLTIRPEYQFKAIDGLLTNFHLPKSSLLVLVSAFAGQDLIMRAYRHAVSEHYRFYSYGDCMLII